MQAAGSRAGPTGSSAERRTPTELGGPSEPHSGQRPLDAANVPPARVLTIDEAVREALQRNPSLEDAEAVVRRARQAVNEARALQLPRLDLAGQIDLHGPNPTFTFTLPPTTPGGTPRRQEITLGKTLTRTAAIVGTYDPDIFGRLRAGREVARRGVNVAFGGLFLAQNELVFSVQSLYLAALRQRELISVAREATEAASEQLRVAEAQFRAGTAPEFDVLRARVQAANDRQTEVAADANYRRTLAALAEVLSADQRTKLEVVPLALPAEPDGLAIATAEKVLDTNNVSAPPGAAVPRTLEAALREAFDRRPEVYRADWQRRAAEERVRLERTGSRPDLKLTASYNYTPDTTGFAAVTESWTILANVSIPIWDAGLTRARVREAQEDVRSARAQVRSARDRVAREVKTALLDLEEALDRRRAAAANTTQAREALRIARVRYTAGIAATVEVTDAEAALTRARSNEVNAAYDYLASLANLNRSLGRYAGETLWALIGAAGR